VSRPDHFDKGGLVVFIDPVFGFHAPAKNLTQRLDRWCGKNFQPHRFSGRLGKDHFLAQIRHPARGIEANLHLFFTHVAGGAKSQTIGSLCGEDPVDDFRFENNVAVEQENGLIAALTHTTGQHQGPRVVGGGIVVIVNEGEIKLREISGQGPSDLVAAETVDDRELFQSPRGQNPDRTGQDGLLANRQQTLGAVSGKGTKPGRLPGCQQDGSDVRPLSPTGRPACGQSPREWSVP